MGLRRLPLSHVDHDCSSFQTIIEFSDFSPGLVVLVRQVVHVRYLYTLHTVAAHCHIPLQAVPSVGGLRPALAHLGAFLGLLGILAKELRTLVAGKVFTRAP